jgi:hypothetical protein
MPILVYNPFTNIFNSPFTVKPYSTYLNFKLKKEQVKYLNEYIQNYSTELSLTKIKLSPIDDKNFYLSLNIYNCSSPLFMNNNKNIIRCEINTYVKHTDGTVGSIILDYSTNGVSIDPVNLFHKPDKNIDFKIVKGECLCKAQNVNIDFSVKYNIENINRLLKYNIDNYLIKYTDIIYYKNGIYDKLYYDSSLVKSVNWIPDDLSDFYFKYKDLQFYEVHSAFFFENNINFICSFWHNLFAK